MHNVIVQRHYYIAECCNGPKGDESIWRINTSTPRAGVSVDHDFATLFIEEAVNVASPTGGRGTMLGLTYVHQNRVTASH